MFRAFKFELIEAKHIKDLEGKKVKKRAKNLLIKEEEETIEKVKSNKIKEKRTILIINQISFKKNYSFKQNKTNKNTLPFILIVNRSGIKQITQGEYLSSQKMMRRSKRQNKSMTDSSDQQEQKNQQLESKQHAGVIQKKTKESKQKQQDDLKPISQNNFLTKTTKKELDSIAINLATQLEKASSNQDNSENSRPKRVRKITEKAEQELLAKQKKVKFNLKKCNDESKTTYDSMIESSKTHIIESGTNQSKKNILQKNIRSQEAETLNKNQQDDQDMDIENLQKQTQFINTRSSSINNDERKQKTKNSHLSQQIDSSDDESQESSDEDKSESSEHNELESDEQDELEQKKEQFNESMIIENEGVELSEMVDEYDTKLKEIKKMKESQTKDLEDTNILKVSNKINLKKEKQELINQNILNTQVLNKQNKVVKKRSVSQEKVYNKQTNSVSKEDEVNNILSNKDEISKLENQEQIDQQQPNKSSIDQNKKQKSSVSKKQKSQKEIKEEINQQEKQQNQEYSEEEQEQSQNEDDENDMRNKNEDEDEENNGSKAKKMPWSEEEDKLVISLVEQHGPQKWTFIAQHIPGRIGKQCRERWHNHLNPKINKEPWGDDEEWILFLCHKLKGNKWAEITQYIPGRTDNAIKNHWNSSMKKRIPELYKRYTQIKCGEDIEYYITPQYKLFEDEILKQLLTKSDDGVDSYFVQTTRRRRNNNSSLVQEIPNNMSNLPLKTVKSKMFQQANEDKQFEDEQSVPLKKKASKVAMKNAAKLNTAVQQEELAVPLNNNFTPNNNNKYSSLHNKALKNFSNSAAASTADVKEIIERIPHNIKEFENFRKQIILYSDEYYQQQHVNQQAINDNDSSLDILSADKGNNNDLNINDSTNLQKILETPLSVEKYVQQNPIFADMVRSALKYKSCQKNLSFVSHAKKNDSYLPSENTTNFDHQLSATSTHNSSVQQKKQSNSQLDQSIDDDLFASAKNGQQVNKKKCGRKPKASKEQADNKQNQEENIIDHKNVEDSCNNDESSINSNRQKKIMHGHPLYMHPMYMMNHPPPHPFYGNHPHHPGFLPPPPHMMGHRQPMMQGYPHPRHLQHPMPPPPPHIQHHYMRNGGDHRHPPQPHHSQMREGSGHQGSMMIPPPPPHHYQQMRNHHYMMPPHNQIYMGGNNSMNYPYSESNNENPSYQTPRKYQKNNKGDRSLFKSVTPTITENYDDKMNKLKINNFPCDEEYNNFFSNNSFQKENADPNIKQPSLNDNKETQIKTTNNGNLNQQQSNNNSNGSNSNGQNQSQQNNLNVNTQNQSHNPNFITPNKYDTPSKLLDFDSEARINFNSVDKYFNMRGYSSNNKITNLYANQNNNFQHSQNSAFKCYPNIDFSDIPSAKKLSYC